MSIFFTAALQQIPSRTARKSSARLRYQQGMQRVYTCFSIRQSRARGKLPQPDSRTGLSCFTENHHTEYDESMQIAKLEDVPMWFGLIHVARISLLILTTVLQQATWDYHSCHRRTSPGGSAAYSLSCPSASGAIAFDLFSSDGRGRDCTYVHVCIR